MKTREELEQENERLKTELKELTEGIEKVKNDIVIDDYGRSCVDYYNLKEYLENLINKH